ncbi:MAG: site-2 protease family protein [Steroidobacteraceae bacterium]
MDLASFLSRLSIAAIPVLFAITLHEVAHGWVARYFGDRTAESQGRLSLNPIRHIDPVGTILVPAILFWLGGFLFGWARPVPVNPRYMRDPRRNMVWVSAAGPAANLIMAVAWAFLMMLSQHAELGVTGQWIGLMADWGITINLVLAVFNMLPIPPLDGGQLLENLLPRGPLASMLAAIRPWGFLIVLLLIASRMLSTVISGPIALLQGLLNTIFGLQPT